MAWEGRSLHGRALRYERSADALLLDKIRPTCNSISDFALLLQATAVWLELGSTSIKGKVSTRTGYLIDTSLFGVCVDVIAKTLRNVADKDTFSELRSAQKNGAQVRARVDGGPLPRLDAYVSAYYGLAMSEKEN